MHRLRSRTRLLTGVVRLPIISVVLLAALLASCAPPTVDLTPSPSPIASPTIASQPAELRFALVGTVIGRNVWALFDAAGYSYNDYAIRSAYWPRLYQLSIPDHQFEPSAAAGLPSAVQPEGEFFVGSVRLRTDLTWSDGTPFTADDVVFTVHTALAFQLGFDWHAAYDAASLDHAQAIDAHTVKFFFRQSPSVAAWQYGALQGPIVQKAYWTPRIAASMALLPSADDRAQIDRLTATAAELQQRIDKLRAGSAGLTGEQARQEQLQIENQQGDLDKAHNDLAKQQAAIDTAMDAARQALYAEDAAKEPTLGTWMPTSSLSGAFVNTANPAHPFGKPTFQRAVYVLYPNQPAALAALQAGTVNSILEAPGSLVAPPATLPADVQAVANPTSLAHFLVVNPLSPTLADPILRRALSCAIDRSALAKDQPVMPLTTFVPGSGVGAKPESADGCGERPARDKSVTLLKSAGYTWSTEPTPGQPGTGLAAPDGQALPAMSLLAPPQQSDPQAAAAAEQVRQAAAYLGLQIDIRPTSAADIRFALFNSRAYDTAIVGWRLGAYPAYLCEWFGDGNPFGYSNAQIGADCAALRTTSNLDAATQKLLDIEQALAQDPGYIPLYSAQTYDLYRGIVYPFGHTTNGLSGVFGVPSLALPASP